MKEFEAPVMDIIMFSEEDVIVTSGPCIEGPHYDQNVCSKGNPSFVDPLAPQS